MRRLHPSVAPSELRSARGAALGLVATVALVLGAVSSVAQAQSATFDEDEIQVLTRDASDPASVELVVAVPGRFGEIEALAANFALTEDGIPREVAVAPLENDVDIWLVVDTSGSMNGAPLDAARGAADVFLERLPNEVSVGVIGFGQTPSTAAPLSLDRDTTKAAIAGLVAGGETALYDALALAAADVRGGSGETFIVLLSDGGDTASGQTLDGAVSLLQSSGVGLYAVALASPESDVDALQRIVTSSGGQLARTDDLAALDGVYGEIAGRLSNRYILRYDSQGAGNRRVVMSIASDGGVATASTEVEVGGLDGGLESVPRTLGDEGLSSSQLREVVIAGPGLFGGTVTLWFGAAAMFGAFALLLLGVAVPGARAQLTAGPSARFGDVNHRLGGAADRLVSRGDRSGKLDQALDAAGIAIRPGEFVLLTAIAAVIVSLGASLLFGFVGASAFVVGAVALLLIVVNIRTSRRRNAFADQLTDTLSILTGSLRSGRGLPQALELVALEAPAPTADEFRRVVVETRIGRDMTLSIEDVADRMRSQDLHWINQAIAINRQLGGDLVEVLDNVADTIRDRRRVARQVRALSAEGRATGWVLLALPILMFAYLRTANPEYAGLLTSTGAGITALVVAVLAVIVGGIWIRKLVDIKY